MQDSWITRISPEDRMFHIGDIEQNDTGLKNLLIFPAARHNIRCPNCSTLRGRDYLNAQLKFPWGLVASYRKLAASAPASMPRWWMLLDDDTYVDPETLHAKLQEYSASQLQAVANLGFGFVDAARRRAEKRVAKARALFEGHGTAWKPKVGGIVVGGSGVAFSHALVEALAERGDEFVESFKTFPMRFEYDWNLMRNTRRVVKAAAFQHDLALHPLTPIVGDCIRDEDGPDGRCIVYRGGRHPLKTFALPPICYCAFSPRPATWHVTRVNKKSMKATLAKLDDYYTKLPRIRRCNETL